MSAVSAVTWILAIAAPPAAWIATLAPSERRRGRLRVTLLAVALGAIAFALAAALEGVLERWAELSRYARKLDFATLVYTFVVAAPLEQGLKVAAVAPFTHPKRMTEPLDGIVYASAAALGFISAHNAVFLWGRPLPSLDLARALLAVPAHLAFASLWGYALGRDRRRRLGGRRFNTAWLGAMLFNGVYDYIVFARGPFALLISAPILIGIGGLAYLAVRDLLRRSEPPARSRRAPRRFLTNLPRPSITAVREALRRTERPILVSWIGFGALVTTGVMTAAVASAVAIGHRIGVDFAAVDRGDTSSAGVAPLFLLGAAALTAFPIAGYLVARASSTDTVLEPAVSAALAILGSVVLLGLAAPVAVVFGLAIAPIAFGLACAGAWAGLSR